MKMKSSRSRALVALLVLVHVMCCMSPAAAIIPWMSFFKKGMGLQGAKSYSAQAFSQPPAGASASSDNDAFVDLVLGASVVDRPVEMTVDKPAAFPIAVTNNGDSDLELTFSVIDTPGPDGESVASLEVLGIRPEDGLPSGENPRKLSVPAGATVDAEIALLSRSSALEGGARAGRRAVTTTGATITAEDEASGRTQFTKDPIELRITDPRGSSSLASRDTGPDGQYSQIRSGERRCVELTEVLRTNGHTDTFAEIWEDTNLNDTLPAGARYTILAPTDAAFDQLTAALDIGKADLMGSPSLDLLLLHHVLPRRLSVDELAALDQVETATCDAIEVGVQDMAVTVSGCEVSASDVDVCNVDLYKLNCVLPPPMMEHGRDLCLPQEDHRSPSAQVISGNVRVISGKNGPPADSSAVDDYYDYDYDYDFDLPPGFPSPGGQRPSRFGVVAANGPAAAFGGSGDAGAGAPETWEWQPLETKVAPRPVPDKWTRLNHLAHAGEAPVKATFLPPGWKEWITPGDLRCPRQDESFFASTECAQIRRNGRSCASPGTLHTCGFLQSTGPKSYQIQPPPEAFQEGFVEMGGGTYVWQSVEGGSAYCTPATEDGSAFRGAVYHEAWVEPRHRNSEGGMDRRGDDGAGNDLDVMLFLLQNPLDGSPWQVVSMQTAPAPGTQAVKRLRTAGQGCFLWVVASAAGSGAYDFHLHVSEQL